MEFQRFLSFLLLILMSFLYSSQAYNFYVGGKDGWGSNPSLNYNQWAERNRFQVNDSLVFKYKKGSDSVLAVSKEDYEKCNTKNPIKTLNGGDSIFKFDKSGPFYFISGEEGSCAKGVKLIVVVMAVRTKTPPSSPSPSPISHPPKSSSSSPSPSPTSVAPKISPSPATTPVTAPSPSAFAPSSQSPSEATTPISSPDTAPSTTPDLSPSADGNTTSDITAQTPAPSSSPSLVSHSTVGFVLVSLVLNSFAGSF